MRAPGPIWRAILWVERFLPAPRPVRSASERPGKSARWVTFVPLFAALPTTLSVLMRRQAELGEIAVRSRVVFEQLALVVTGCVILAVIGCAIHFGAKAWRDAGGSR